VVIGMQLHRAALSIVSNIAEGHDADYLRVYLRSLSDANGSTREAEAQILVIRRRKYVPENETNTALELVDEIGRMLRALSMQLRAKAQARNRGRST
jgi:four helix bundle protein